MSALEEFPRTSLAFPGRSYPHLIKKPAAMQAMLKMTKLDIAELERAAKG
jgi:predicted 3-demethylubiquinone-9 3-methyltransferase (glyoxalase superfamily)